MPLKINLERLEALREGDPGAYEEALEALNALDGIKEADPLQLYEPAAEKDRRFHGAQTRIKAFLGGNQSGKSTTSIVDDLIQAVDRDCVPERLRPLRKFEPPFLCRIITPDFTETMEGVVFEKIREWVPRSQLLGGSWEAAFDKQLRKMRFANGAWVECRGVPLDRLHFDEEPPGAKGRKIFLQALVRIMKRGGDLVFSMTPEMGVTGMFDDGWGRRGDAGGEGSG